MLTASTSIAELRHNIDLAKGSAGRLRDGLLSYTLTVQSIQNVTNAITQISGALNKATEENRAFSGAMKAANTMAGKEAEDFAKLKNEVSELSKTLPVVREELANGLYQVISNRNKRRFVRSVCVPMVLPRIGLQGGRC